MKRLLGAVFVLSALAFASPAFAQLACPTPTSCTVTVPMVPAQVTVAWDPDANTPDVNITGYAVYDGTTRVLTVGLVNQTPVPLNTFATHTLTVTALGSAVVGGASVESAKSSSLTVLVQQSLPQATPPLAPQNFRFATAAASCSTTSAFGTTGPTVTDGGCHVFTLSGIQVLRDGAGTNGAGSIFTFVPSGVYVLGTDSVWYLFSIASDGTATWTNIGATKPTA